MRGPTDIRALRLAVIGTGALGSALLWRLAEAGFRSVLLIDPDEPEERNLPLSPFLAEAQCGYHVRDEAAGTADPRNSKAQLLAAHVRAHGGLPWCALPCEVADVGWQHLREVDLFCCCTDSALSRAETAFVTRALGKPVVDGAVFGNGIAEGRVTCFSAAPDAACYLCGMGEDRRAAVLGYAASASLGCHVPEDAPAMTGTLATLQKVAGAMVSRIEQSACQGTFSDASSAIKLTWTGVSTSVGTHADSPAVLGDDQRDDIKVQPPNTDGQSPDRVGQWRREHVQLTRSAGCPWHDGPATLVPLPWEIPLCESLAALPPQEVQFAWPVCTEAVCTACGERCAPFVRVAAVRRSLRCPSCGAANLQPLRAMHRLGTREEAAKCTPRQLGQPRQHLYSLRCTAV